ncbi:DUF4365 domain-containing protein [Sorangium sp. So ce1153]|uniref:DUF4365 domain-containing protein n=1 Tax=Sorangium sp. So ce1153 TaxID=3133333 RepID=UPI003F6411C5
MNDDGLGPLPKADSNSALQRRSLQALAAALSSDEFILRDERVDDFGVDVTLEVISNSRATNCRSQVQLKARSGLEMNRDGSFSVSVETTNLNYLLNGPCPLYVLFRPETSDLFFAFAMDEQVRISSLDESWSAKASATIRFRTKIDQATIAVIRERIINEAKRHRRLRDEIAFVLPNGRARIEFDASEGPGRVTGPEAAEELLLRDGMNLVSWGFASRVVEIAALLQPQRFRDAPKLSLVLGYAHFSNGNYLAADASLRAARARRLQLESEDRHFLLYLTNVVALVFGEISAEVFRGRSEAWRVDAPEVLQLQYDVLRLWTLRSEAATTQLQEQYHEQLMAVLRRIDALTNAPEAIRQHARLLIEFHEIQDRVMALTQALINSRDPGIWRHAYDKEPRQVIDEELHNLERWRLRVRELIDTIRTTGNASLFCQALHTRDAGEAFVIGQLIMAAAMTETIAPTVPERLFEQIHATQSAAVRFDQPELELRSRLLEADVADLARDRARAVELATAVRENAEALRHMDIERSATRIIAHSHHAERLEEIRKLHEEGIEVVLAQMTDEDLDDLARNSCALMRVPPERLPVLRDGAECQRTIAREKLSWCRYIEIREDASHEASPATLYAWYPERVARCALLSRQSAVPSKDWSAVIAAFKASHCSGCSHRTPRRAE